jgi:hypothetical protein
MGERCTLSGHIQEPWYFNGSDKELSELWENNKQVIEKLPEKDDFSFLVRGMFSFSPTPQDKYSYSETTYRGRVIYFGGSFSKLYADWSEWLSEFENLLRQLYWEHATVVLVTELYGNHTYHWQATPEAIEKFSLTPPHTVNAWIACGKPRSFLE